MKKISIIVPVYNVEQYLQECIEHLLMQEYSIYEIILIDNSSTDNSLEICEKYAEQDTRIKVIKLEENKGPSEARNIGISLSKGEYIGFCDSDDYFEKDMVKKMVNQIELADADYVIGDMYCERISDNLGLPWKSGTIFKGVDIAKKMIPMYIGNESDNDKNIPVWGSVVKCLFRRSVIINNEIKFPVGINFAEDLIFTLNYLCNIKTATVLNDPIYFYRFNVNSLMNSHRFFQKNMYESRLFLISEINKIMKSQNIYDENQNRLFTTTRAYIKECIGNACKIDKIQDAHKEVKKIMHNPITKEAFKKFDANNIKNKSIYTLIKWRCSLLLTMYYRMRMRK